MPADLHLNLIVYIAVYSYNRGAEIYCERRGNGPLLLLIHGAMEDAGFYSSAADILARKFIAVSYDRRCNSRSSGDRSADMTVAQQASDAAYIR